jgi:ribosomal protein S18 acetylase RimI-like enzyme
MEYRLYKPEDFAALYAIEEVCFHPPLRFPRRFMRQLVEARESATWIAEENGTMAGFSIVEWAEDVHGIHASIATIEVLPEHRKRGIGKELMHLMEQSVRAANAAIIGLHVDPANAGAVRLYESLGFVLVGSEDDFYAPDRHALVYRKALMGKPTG